MAPSNRKLAPLKPSTVMNRQFGDIRTPNRVAITITPPALTIYPAHIFLTSRVTLENPILGKKIDGLSFAEPKYDGKQFRILLNETHIIKGIDLDDTYGRRAISIDTHTPGGNNLIDLVTSFDTIENYPLLDPEGTFHGLTLKTPLWGDDKDILTIKLAPAHKLKMFGGSESDLSAGARVRLGLRAVVWKSQTACGWTLIAETVKILKPKEEPMDLSADWTSCMADSDDE